MKTSHSAVRAILLINGLIGGALVLAGLLAEARPHVLLDVVLNQDEIRDVALADKTLTLLKRGAGRDSLVMIGSGSAVALTAFAASFILAQRSDDDRRRE